MAVDAGGHPHRACQQQGQPRIVTAVGRTPAALPELLLLLAVHTGLPPQYLVLHTATLQSVIQNERETVQEKQNCPTVK